MPPGLLVGAPALVARVDIYPVQGWMSPLEPLEKSYLLRDLWRARASEAAVAVAGQPVWDLHALSFSCRISSSVGRLNPSTSQKSPFFRYWTVLGVVVKLSVASAKACFLLANQVLFSSRYIGNFRRGVVMLAVIISLPDRLMPRT